MTTPWRHIVRLDEITQRGLTCTLAPDPVVCAQLARQLNIVSLDALEARLVVTQWFDGAEVHGEWSAKVAQACVVTLEPLTSSLMGEFVVRVVPAGSIHAPDENSLSELDPEADDPPDVSETGEFDLAGYVIEHLALEIDPYPRKPGAEFAPQVGPTETSPFAVLKGLKKDT